MSTAAADVSAVASQASGGHEERHEVKFAAYVIDHPRLEHWLKMHPIGFITPFPNRQVNNVYFDTFDYRAYADNLAGISERNKVRYRWYGDSAGPAAGQLEVKCKKNQFGWKLRYPVNEAPFSGAEGWRAIRERMRAQMPLDGRLWLDQNPLPVMINRYERQYFATSDGRMRATIDVNQRYYDQRNGDIPNFDHASVSQDSLVVEFKFAREDRKEAVQLLEAMPLRIGRHSKYMNAVNAIGLVK